MLEDRTWHVQDMACSTCTKHVQYKTWACYMLSNLAKNPKSRSKNMYMLGTWHCALNMLDIKNMNMHVPGFRAQCIFRSSI